MIVRDIGRDRRVWPPGHDDPQPVRRSGRQQCRDAVGIGAGCHATVLIQAIDHQHQPLPRPALFLGGPAEHAQQVRLPGRRSQVRRNRLSEQLGELFHNRIREGIPIVMALIAGCDEEADYLHAGGRVQYEPRHQCRLTRPGRRTPPRIRPAIGIGAECHQLS